MNKAKVTKPLAVGVIVLLLGLAFAPSINANISKSSLEKETVEFTTEVCGLGGGRHTVQLNKAEAEEVEALFDTIRERLNATETRKEAEEIFKEAVVELDSYGLIPYGFNFDKIIQLMMKCIPNSKFPSDSLDKGKFFNKSNFINFLFGIGDEMLIMNHINLIIMIIYYNLLHYHKLPLLQFFLLLMTVRPRMRLFGGGIYFSGNSSAITIGLNGIQKSERNDFVIMLIGFVGLIFTSPVINFAIGFNLMSFFNMLPIIEQ